MGEHIGGGDHGPTFIDVYGTSRRLGLEKPGSRQKHAHGFEGPHPDGPFWLRGLRGQLPLWVAFWGGFFFGHGIVLAFAVGAMIIGVVAGLTLDPQKVDESMTIAGVIMYLVGAIMTLFAMWSTITVWRSAAEAAERKWGIAARCVVVSYLAVWGVTIWNVAT